MQFANKSERKSRRHRMSEWIPVTIGFHDHEELMTTLKLIRKHQDWVAQCVKMLNKLPNRLALATDNECPLHFLSTVCQVFHQMHTTDLESAQDALRDHISRLVEDG